jgi:hypothetical protein
MTMHLTFIATVAMAIFMAYFLPVKTAYHNGPVMEGPLKRSVTVGGELYAIDNSSN